MSTEDPPKSPPSSEDKENKDSSESAENSDVFDEDKIVKPVPDHDVVVLAMDASRQAEHAINWYIDHVHRRGNRLVFVHCVELPEMKLNQASEYNPKFNLHNRSMHMSPGVLAGMWKEEETKTKALELKLKEVLKTKGIAGMLRTATGKPGEAICRIAEEEEASMIVTGTRGMGKVRRTILGSVSDYLVHHAHCPVIVARHPSECVKSRRWSFSSDGKRSRHSSGEKSRHTSGDPDKQRQREKSGDSFFTRLRHFSGDKHKGGILLNQTKERSKSVDEAYE